MTPPKVFDVYPSRSGDDTANIQEAFDACVVPGCTVHFKAGLFHTNTIVVRDFHGSVTGEGQGKTVIDSLRGLNKSLPGVTVTDPDTNHPTIPFPVPFLIGFDGGNVSMSDLTFEITARDPAEDWKIFDNEVPFTDLRVVVLITGDTSSKFVRVDFIGHEGTFFGVNVCHAILVGGMRQLVSPGGPWGTIQPTHGIHRITSSSFKGVSSAIAVQQLTDGKLTVGGNATHGNFFDAAIAFNPSDNPNSDVEFSYNDIHTYYIGVWIQDWEAVPGGGPKAALPGRYVVQYNTIDVRTIDPEAQPNGVVLTEESRAPMAAATFKALVAHNAITINGSAGGIWGCNARDVEIRDNTISGVGVAGIYAGTSEKVNLGWVIKDNDVEQVAAAKARIWLGPGTSQCTVIVPNIETTVLDEGSNVLTRVLHVKHPLRPSKPAVQRL